MEPAKRKAKKKKAGRPAFSRRDIPAAFYTYYDFYRYGHFNKREFAEFLLVSRPTLDRYLESIHAKPPLLTKAENNKLRKQCGIGNSFGERFRFVYQLKELKPYLWVQKKAPCERLSSGKSHKKANFSRSGPGKKNDPFPAAKSLGRSFFYRKKQEHPERIAPLIAEGAAHILCGLLLIFILHLE